VVETDPKAMQDLTLVVQTLLQQMQDKFQTVSYQIVGRIDGMTSHIDDLVENIVNVMTQAEMEELSRSNALARSLRISK
uniref:Heat shock factor-binding protein 1 n=1 Tax=Panthera tigris altaica TaxID=74533 RepID=A0A8C9JBI7_PANTA